MDEAAGDWFSAEFREMPNIGLIDDYRRLAGPTISLFFVRAESGSQTALYLPPEATRLVRKINTDGKLPPFRPSCRPSWVRVQLLLGDESELTRYFPERATNSSAPSD